MPQTGNDPNDQQQTAERFAALRRRGLALREVEGHSADPAPPRPALEGAALVRKASAGRVRDVLKNATLQGQESDSWCRDLKCIF